MTGIRTLPLRALRDIIVGLLSLHTVTAHAVITPTEIEWLTWPDFCKAGFLASDWSANSPFKGRIPQDQLRSMNPSEGGGSGIPGVHHFCGAMLYLNRAKSARNPTEKNNLAKSAVVEIEYSYSRMRTTAPMYSLVTAYYGTALHRAGKPQQAIDMWKKGIATQPKARESYLAMAEVLLEEKKPKEALEVLLNYEQLKEYDAPDAEYFIGHTYFELKQYDKAREHADKAYQLGYPFPGLRDKLKRVGK